MGIRIVVPGVLKFVQTVLKDPFLLVLVQESVALEQPVELVAHSFE